MKVRRTISVDVDLDVDISFEEACKIVLEKMYQEHCEALEMIIDNAIRDEEKIKRISVDELMKKEVLEKIKDKFTLEEIEKFYESKR